MNPDDPDAVGREELPPEGENPPRADEAGAGQESFDPAAEQGADESVSEFGFSQADIDALLSQASSTSEEDAGGASDTGMAGLDEAAEGWNDVDAAMEAAMAEEQAAAKSSGGESRPAVDASASRVELPTFDHDSFASDMSQPVSLLHDVQLHVKIELGRTHMYIEDVLRLGEGSVVELDRLAGDPVDVYVNDRLVARGEVLVLNDNFCIRVSEIISEAGVNAER